MYNGVFSEFELVAQKIKFSGDDEEWMEMSCVGSSKDDPEEKTITKKCRGRVERSKTIPTGNGSITQSLHMPLKIYRRIFNMSADTTLKEGVYAYGQPSVHEEFSLVHEIHDEDGEVMFRAYPRVTVETGFVVSIENGAEEVGEVELTYKYMPDSYKQGKYEALKSDLVEAESASGYTGDKLSEVWMTDWSVELMHTEA